MGELAQFGSKDDVRPLAGKLLERRVIGITGPDLGRFYVKPDGLGGVFVINLE